MVPVGKTGFTLILTTLFKRLYGVTQDSQEKNFNGKSHKIKQNRTLDWKNCSREDPVVIVSFSYDTSIVTEPLVTGFYTF